MVPQTPTSTPRPQAPAGRGVAIHGQTGSTTATVVTPFPQSSRILNSVATIAIAMAAAMTVAATVLAAEPGPALRVDLSKLPPAAQRPVDFVRDIQPLFATHCLSCHGVEKQRSGLRLDDRDRALRGGENFSPVIQPGRSADSPLIHAVAGLLPEANLAMPPKGEPLTPGEIGLLRAWIDQGAAWPVDPKAARTGLWSLRPVERPPVPSESSGPSGQPLASSGSGTRSGTVNPVDAFLAEGLREKQLAFNPPAPRRTFIRRLYLVMHGLPPSPEAVERFVADSRPDAVERLVDEVLASPRYGERWARHWLDIVRYADSNGFETNRERKNAYPYRDYVIESFNADKPYDRFIREQLAGDALGADAGTGFLVAGAYDIVKSPDINLTLMQRQDELADIVNTTGTAFLGLTLGCARCHDHKFDPISQKEYYAVQAVFAGVQFADRPLRRVPTEAEQAELVERRRELAEQEQSLAALKEQARTGAPADPARPIRPAVTARLNEETFAPVTATALRFQISATTGGEPGLDELEVYDARGTNVALASLGTKPSASGTLPGYAIHQLAHLNDGIPGNSRSWISDTAGKGWVRLDFPAARSIQRIVWSRDRDGQFKDRVATDYRIEVATPAGEWVEVASHRGREPVGTGDPNAFLQRLGAAEAQTAKALMASIATTKARITKLADGQSAWLGTFSQPKPTHRLYRGEPLQEREVVAPGGVAAISRLSMDVDEPEQKRRVRLAEWIASPTNPLTARVMVNRVWHYLFGTGLVDTPSDFGANGGVPVNPALLDWLADELVQSGWSLKQLQKWILLSRAFGQSSTPRAEALAVDAEARRLWRFPPRRLEAEAIRDGMLAVSGALDLRVGGPGFHLQKVEEDNVYRYFPKEDFGPEEFRRMVYLARIRQEQDSVFGSFDCPSGNQVTPKRTRSNTPLQALNLFNSRFVLQQAELLANRLRREAGQPVAAQVERAFQLMYGRNPDGYEQRISGELIQAEGLEAFCRALYNTSESLFIF